MGVGLGCVFDAGCGFSLRVGVSDMLESVVWIIGEISSTLQALHRQTKLASPLLPEISVDSWGIVRVGQVAVLGIGGMKETNEAAD